MAAGVISNSTLVPPVHLVKSVAASQRLDDQNGEMPDDARAIAAASAGVPAMPLLRTLSMAVRRRAALMAYHRPATRRASRSAADKEKPVEDEKAKRSPRIPENISAVSLGLHAILVFRKLTRSPTVLTAARPSASNSKPNFLLNVIDEVEDGERVETQRLNRGGWSHGIPIHFLWRGLFHDVLEFQEYLVVGHSISLA